MQWIDSGLMAMKMDDYTEGRAKQNTSPSTQRTDYDMRVVKTYNNTESRARLKEDSWEATDDSTEGCNQEGTSTSSGQTLV